MHVDLIGLWASALHILQVPERVSFFIVLQFYVSFAKILIFLFQDGCAALQPVGADF